MSFSTTFPSASRPKLLLDFANMGRLDPRISFVRATAGTYFDNLGVLRNASANTARFDYDPVTLQPKGLLIEEQRTNSIRNNTMQGAAAGTPGTMPTNWSTYTVLTGLTREVVGTGTENGITYVDVRISGTPSAAGIYGIYFEPGSQVAATSGQIWTLSSYIKLAAGSTTGVIEVRNAIAENNSGGNFLAGSSTPVIPTSAALSSQRVSVTRTFNQATTAFLTPYWDIALSGAAIDITLRIGLPQLEQGAFPTSVILTTTIALTRNADVASMTGTNFSSWYNASEGTLFTSAAGVANISGATRRYAEINDSGSLERIIVGYSGTTSTRLLVQDGGASQADVIVATPSVENVIKMAAVYKTNDFQQASNGTLGLADTSGTLPTVDRMFIGSADGLTANTFLNGTIRRIAYYNTRLTNAQLQALTR